MSTQEIQNYKLNWLSNKCFRVPVTSSDGEHYQWLKENIDERVWEMSVHPKTKNPTFFFQNATDAEKFREQFRGESRTVDIG